MRFAALLLLCAGVLLAAAGCDPVADRKFMNEGAGVDLYTASGKNQTELQNEYVSYVCQQAGLASSNCNVDTFSPTVWTLFVQAGMNDIDQRCDAYLTWLDAKRRDRDVVLNEITQVAATTHSIMAISGAGVDSLDIVTAALGLASATYMNWNSRLLLAVNQSTVQTIVYSRQHQFREQINGKAVNDRPQAIYLLRNYLRLCMPTTIEADINTSTTLVQRGDPNAAKKPVVQTVIEDVRKPLPPTPPHPPVNPTGHTQAERSMGPTEVAKIEAALCVAGGPDLGPDESPTRLAIRDYLIGIRYGGVTEATKTIDVDDRIRTRLNNAMSQIGDCAASQFKFAAPYEVGLLGIPSNKTKERITLLQTKLKKFLATNASNFAPPDVNGILDQKTRAAIAKFRELTVPPQPRASPFDQQLDPAIYAKIAALPH